MISTKHGMLMMLLVLERSIDCVNGGIKSTHSAPNLDISPMPTRPDLWPKENCHANAAATFLTWMWESTRKAVPILEQQLAEKSTCRPLWPARSNSGQGNWSNCQPLHTANLMLHTLPLLTGWLASGPTSLRLCLTLVQGFCPLRLSSELNWPLHSQADHHQMKQSWSLSPASQIRRHSPGQPNPIYH